MTLYRNVLIGAACVAAVDAFSPTFGFTGMLMIYDFKICAEQELIEGKVAVVVEHR